LRVNLKNKINEQSCPSEGGSPAYCRLFAPSAGSSAGSVEGVSSCLLTFAADRSFFDTQAARGAARETAAGSPGRGKMFFRQDLQDLQVVRRGSRCGPGLRWTGDLANEFAESHAHPDRRIGRAGSRLCIHHCCAAAPLCLCEREGKWKLEAGRDLVGNPDHRMIFIKVFRIPCDQDAAFAICSSPDDGVGKFEPVLSSSKGSSKSKGSVPRIVASVSKGSVPRIVASVGLRGVCRGEGHLLF